MTTSVQQDQRIVRKVMHPLKIRVLQVKRVASLNPYLLRITFTGPDLHDFISPGFDDHVKIFLPPSIQDGLVLPELGPKGLVFPEGQPRPVSRDYTPRRFDAQKLELDIDFVLHGHGPGASWAAQARPGQTVGIGGPRGSFIIPHDYDWHLLIGDETALPAVARRLEALPEEARILAVLETRHPDARIPLATHSDPTIHWAYRGAGYTGGMSVMERVVRRLQLPEGEGYVWAAGESAVVRSIRAYLVEECGIDKQHIRAASYWRQGASGVHETISD
ncbi:siderophore-interacting protein [Allopusillimonas soli]|uniref:Siderophore-interacting protein n=1 Tax=Allopusillimonas soli TaxID=659016 RepID=A0A853FDH6_9BURK|nr:siderophore-interacting protein [Allopusillimonas soli]NYT37778.1 siderophore-interacting protein [Allopusillimonas soli]TEA73692.1 siderophore-interacting protein [Allopusillimonas soli]